MPAGLGDVTVRERRRTSRGELFTWCCSRTRGQAQSTRQTFTHEESRATGTCQEHKEDFTTRKYLDIFATTALGPRRVFGEAGIRERQTSRLKPFTLVFNYFQLAVRIESLSWKRLSLTVSPVSIALRVLLPLPQIAHKPRILTVNAMSENTSIASLPGLRGKVALVTGSTAGIGLAIARQLVASGCHVMVNGRSTASCEAACNSMLDDMEGQAIPISGDVATAEGVQALVEKVEAARVQRKLPPVSILINNVGVLKPRISWTLPMMSSSIITMSTSCRASDFVVSICPV